MRKLLISLIALCTSSITLANVLDNGNYDGYLQQLGSNQDAASGNILNDQVDIYIPILSALGATSGKLTGTIITTTNNTDNCINNAIFTAKLQGMTITASNVTLNNCKYENGIFSGNYDADIANGFFHSNGVFSFTKN